MKRNFVVILAVGFVLCFCILAYAADLAWEDIGGGNLDIESVLLEADKPQVIYIGTGSSVLKTQDGGKNWKNVLFVKGENKKVNFVSFDPQDKNSLYAATGNGLFYSQDKGQTWKRIFQGKNFFEADCTSLAVLPYEIYLGTRGGLFVSRDKGRTWQKATGNLSLSSILNIVYNPKEINSMYVACRDGIFKTEDGGKTWERVFVVHATEDENGAGETNEDRDEMMRVSNVRYIACDPNNVNQLYLATKRGIFSSQDRGKTWRSVSSFGLLSQDIKFLLLSDKSDIYTATQSGIFMYKDERWQELSLNLSVSKINFLAQDYQNNLYAACDRGLFKANMHSFNREQQDSIMSMYYKDEPSINEMQEAAIRYAEVEPEKIKAWRERAARKALLPQVSVGIDRNTTDLWHWEGGSTTKVDDDILRKGNDSLEWDVRLTWDLGELIWNDDQTNIDVRSRLMVELRDDILDQVTKIYFERLRVKMELNSLAIEDRKKRFEKELRLQELTAMLDALTGGYFSQQIKNNKI
jgi:photosystem II stability/assembly factor-like uncharacterized protein